jgi:hypothetical protein
MRSRVAAPRAVSREGSFPVPRPVTFSNPTFGARETDKPVVGQDQARGHAKGGRRHEAGRPAQDQGAGATGTRGRARDPDLRCSGCGTVLVQAPPDIDEDELEEGTEQ